MKRAGSPTWVRGLVAVFGMTGVGAMSHAQIGSSTVSPTASSTPSPTASAVVNVASLSWDPAPDALLVSYREIWGEFANQDPTPLIRLFGDGRVLIHYPVYSPKAGEYALWLHPDELETEGKVTASA